MKMTYLLKKKGVMNLKKLLIFSLSVLLVIGLLTSCQQKTTESKTTEGKQEEQKSEETVQNIEKFGDITVNKDTGEVIFEAKVKKPEHPSGDDPTKLSEPNALVNESQGSAIPAAALVAEGNVNADLLVQALEALGLNPGKNIAKGEKGKYAEGDPVKIEVEINGTRYLFDDLLKKGNPNIETNYVFIGNNEVQKAIGCGCLICGRSGPGTVLANAVYSTSDPAPIGPTLYKGLIDSGAKDGDVVKIIVSKR